ncbi:MAG: Na+/H+ antiporter NhaA [Deltaproteobacteria bacterium]|nr:Na+/H+ antiporter NhaA [Deltaproteobacteria bacterium]
MIEHAKHSLRLLSEFSIPLVIGVVVAVVWANIDPASHDALLEWSPFGHGNEINFHFIVNDIFMALFFGVATKEIVESVLPGGALNPPKKAVNPLLGTLGGVLGPIAVYFGWVVLRGDTTIINGWGIPTATDIALAWLVARMIFGKGHPAVSFLLLLAVADDALGLGIIAVFYPDPAHPVQPMWLLAVAGAMAASFGMKKAGLKNFWPYLIGPGLLSWYALHSAHLHPALALVPIIPFMPHATHDEGLFAEEGGPEVHTDALNRFEHAFKYPVDFGLFAFGIANAGVAFSSVGEATYGVFLALLVGKTLGIFGFAMAGDKLGFPLPEGMNARSLFVAGMVGGLGLTVALFVAGVAFTDPALQGAAKMGALGSAFIAPLAFIAGKLLNARKLAEPRADVESGEQGTSESVPAAAQS